MLASLLVSKFNKWSLHYDSTKLQEVMSQRFDRVKGDVKELRADRKLNYDLH